MSTIVSMAMRTALVAMVLAAGCANRGLSEPQTTATGDVSVQSAQQLFDGQCAACHSGADLPATETFDTRHASDFRSDMRSWLMENDEQRINHPGPKLTPEQWSILMTWSDG